MFCNSFHFTGLTQIDNPMYASFPPFLENLNYKTASNLVCIIPLIVECTAPALIYFFFKFVMAHCDGKDQILAELVVPTFLCQILSFKISTPHDIIPDKCIFSVIRYCCQRCQYLLEGITRWNTECASSAVQEPETPHSLYTSIFL